MRTVTPLLCCVVISLTALLMKLFFRRDDMLSLLSEDAVFIGLLCLSCAGIFALVCIKWILPRLSDAIANFFYGDGYTASDDEVVRLVAQIRQTHSEKDLILLKRYAEENPRFLRAQTEYASVLKDVFCRPHEAANVYETVAARLRNKQDKALFLYRAACLFDGCSQTEKAHRLWMKTAELYPETVYGKEAARKMGK